MAAQTANVTIGGYPFVCVSLANADFTDVASIYVILCVGQDGKWSVVDVGETGELGDRIDSHDRKTCWQNNCSSGNIWVCAYRMPSAQYTPEDRRKVEKQIRDTYGPLPCGTR